jgi:quercetin dioxygenase-like cupin family protein
MAGVVDIGTLGTEEYPYAVYRRIFETDRMAASLVAVRPGAAVAPHTHHDEEQIYYVLRGQGTVTLDSRRQAVGPGSAVYIPLGTEHGVQNDSQTDTFEYLYVVSFIRPGQTTPTG